MTWLLALILTCGKNYGDDPVAVDKELRVALFTGSERGVPFWELFVKFMKEAANDLGIELEEFYADGNWRKMESQISEACERPDPPDAIVVQNFKRSGPKALRIAERYRVPVFLVNAGLNAEQRKKTGNPREKLKFWIGERLPDDFGAGFDLANELIDEALKDPKRLGPDGRVHVIAINGVVSHSASVLREAGLRQAVSARSNEAVLEQVIAADWQRKLARLRCRFLHRRYPHASAVWTASDHMAAGVIDAITDRDLTPGTDVIIGGVDATPEAIQLIKQGTLHATTGGHFMEGGWVAVLLHDYLRGVDAATIPAESDSPMTMVTRENLAQYQLSLEEATWHDFDFRTLSRYHHPELASYHFGTGVLAPSDESRAETSTQVNQDDDSANNSGENR